MINLLPISIVAGFLYNPAAGFWTLLVIGLLGVIFGGLESIKKAR